MSDDNSKPSNDMDNLKDKIAEFLPAKKEKPLNSQILFPELAKEIASYPNLTVALRGLFIVTVLKKGVKKDEWYMLFPGGQAPPTISTQRPSIPFRSGDNFPVVVIELEDNDILNFITGGLNGLKAYVSGRIRILGDLEVALKLEEVFNKTGGVEKAMKFLKDHNINVSSASSSGHGKKKGSRL